MVIVVEHLKYQMKFGMEMVHIEQLYDIHVYVPN